MLRRTYLFCGGAGVGGGGQLATRGAARGGGSSRASAAVGSMLSSSPRLDVLHIAPVLCRQPKHQMLQALLHSLVVTDWGRGRGWGAGRAKSGARAGARCGSALRPLPLCRAAVCRAALPGQAGGAQTSGTQGSVKGLLGSAAAAPPLTEDDAAQVLAQVPLLRLKVAGCSLCLRGCVHII